VFIEIVEVKMVAERIMDACTFFWNGGYIRKIQNEDSGLPSGVLNDQENLEIGKYILENKRECAPKM
jgi:hypothetical protein